MITRRFKLLSNIMALLHLGGGERGGTPQSPRLSAPAGNSPLPIRSGRVSLDKKPLTFQGSKSRTQEQRMDRDRRWRARRKEAIRIPGVLAS